MILFDFDGDGRDELVVGNIKGMISVFKYKGASPIYSCGNLGSITCTLGVIMHDVPILCVVSAEGSLYLFKKESSGIVSPFLTLKVPCNITSILISGSRFYFGSLDRNLYVYDFKYDHDDLSKGSLYLFKKHFCDRQIYCLAFHKSDQLKVIAGYQVGGYGVFDGEHFVESTRDEKFSIDLPFFVMGNVDFGGFGDSMLSINLEGRLEIHKPLESALWSMDLEEEIVGVQNAKFTESNDAEICIVTWDGITHIIDSDKNIVRFNFRDRVCSFIVGKFHLSEKESRLCIFYSTFTDKIIMFSDITMTSIPSYDLHELVLQKASPQILEKLQGLDRAAITQLYKDFLYKK